MKYGRTLLLVVAAGSIAGGQSAIAQTRVPVPDVPVTVDNKPYAPPETVQRVAIPVDPKEERLHVLIISGRNSYEHDWTGVNNRLRTILQDTGRFDVRITEDFDEGNLTTLRNYDVVFLNYSSRWNYADKEQHLWSDRAFKALYDYVREGGGLVAYHSSFTWGRDIPEYRRLVGAVMEPGISRRAPPDAFMFELVDREHPVTKGMRRYHWSFMDDMYTNMVFAPEARVTVLATAYDDAAAYAPEKTGPKYDFEAYRQANLLKMGKINAANPQVWVQDYGKGRVFSITLGHGPDTIQYDGVKTLLVRGAEWAASGKVTIPAYDKATDYEIPEQYRTRR